jgi:predicted NBD/HSP70 family sugar kinase
MKQERNPARRVLVVDIGGTNVKLLATGEKEPRKVPSGKQLTPRAMVRGVLAATRDWKFDAVSIGYPGPVREHRPAADPPNLGRGWVRFDFRKAFGRPVKILNDAAMQALGSYEGGRMLFLGLGTGLGSAMVVDGVVVPMELAHLPYRHATFEDAVGARALEKHGKKKWRRSVDDVVGRLRAALVADYVVIGGGNVKKLRKLPESSRRGDNVNAFAGGFLLWEGDR